jgi:hypothetical protein
MVPCEDPPPPIPDFVVEWDGHTTTGGGQVLGSPRSIGHLQFTADKAAERGLTLMVIQSAWHRGVDFSKHTHDYDAVYDFAVGGLPWNKGQMFLRRWGWAAWHRTPIPDVWDNHIHGISLGCGTRPCVDVGDLIPSQLDDYENKAFGLEDMHVENSDTSWRPDPQFVFDFEEWLKGSDDVQIDERIPGTQDKEVKDALATIFDIDRRTRNIMEGIHRAVGGVRDLRADISADQTLDADTQERLFNKIDRVRDQLLDAIATENA